MNTYLIPVFDGSSTYIEKVMARSLSSAEDKFIDMYISSDDDIPEDWEEFLSFMEDAGYIIGEPCEISEFC